ncbi:uncharacterized protein METZ01_LOCUS215670 [marine metagenome]|uniref:Uncharacterized protein n=1 Tax=marine metagenome TaxID=408172 RepID=A0A382FI88_9ZZZZ
MIQSGIHFSQVETECAVVRDLQSTVLDLSYHE